MKGIILSEFIEFAEQQFGREAIASLIAESGTSFAGRYQAIERYDHDELVRLVHALAAQQGLAAAELLCRFGRSLFGRFAAMYPLFLADADDTLSLLTGIDRYIHGELQQLYPDGEFPTFHCRTTAPGQLEMLYDSARPFADLAEGLIRGCAEHFGESVDIRREDAAAAGRHAVRFVVTTTPR